MTSEAARSQLAPTRNLTALLVAYFGVQLVVNAGNSGAAQFLLPLQLDALDPAAKVAHLGIVNSVAAVLAIVAQPLWGWLSDRTRSRLGRRVPWVLGGVVGLAACFVALALSSSFLAILVFASSIQVFYSMVAGPLFALVPDRTPIDKRGLFSALGGIGIYLGIAAGTFAASPFAEAIPVGYLVLAAVLVVLATPLAFLVRRDSRALPRPGHVPVRRVLGEFWVSPREFPDFWWAFAARLILMTGFWGISSFLLYQLQDYIGLSTGDAARLVPVMSAVLIVALVVAIVPAGWVSDRIGRRKPFVVGGSFAIALSAVVPLVWPTLPALFTSLVVAGLGLGVYMSVDQALMTQVLPNASSAGKDLGLLNIAQAGGQVLAPVVASVVITAAGYRAEWAFVAVMAVIGGLAFLPMRSVR